MPAPGGCTTGAGVGLGLGRGAFGVPIGPCSSSCAANSGATAWQYKFEKRLPNGKLVIRYEKEEPPSGGRRYETSESQQELLGAIADQDGPYHVDPRTGPRRAGRRTVERKRGEGRDDIVQRYHTW